MVMVENFTTPWRNHVSWLDTAIEIVKTDALVNQEYEDDVRMHLAFAATVLFVIPVNGYVLYWLRTKTRTLVDSMVLHDCIANIGGMLGMFLVYPRHGGLIFVLHSGHSVLSLSTNQIAPFGN